MNDLISRQAAIDVLNDFANKETTSTEKAVAIDYCKEILKALPSAQPEIEKKILAIGYTGKEGRIRIGGRLFAVRELAQ